MKNHEQLTSKQLNMEGTDCFLFDVLSLETMICALHVVVYLSVAVGLQCVHMHFLNFTGKVYRNDLHLIVLL